MVAEAATSITTNRNLETHPDVHTSQRLKSERKNKRLDNAKGANYRNEGSAVICEDVRQSKIPRFKEERDMEPVFQNLRMSRKE